MLAKLKTITDEKARVELIARLDAWWGGREFDPDAVAEKLADAPAAGLFGAAPASAAAPPSFSFGGSAAAATPFAAAPPAFGAPAGAPTFGGGADTATALVEMDLPRHDATFRLTPNPGRGPETRAELRSIQACSGHRQRQQSL